MDNYSNEADVVKVAARRYYPEEIDDPAHQKTYLMVKRTLDTLGALAGILLCLPIFIVLPILIKLEDPKGSVIFRQIRVGKDGRTFQMYKFRSMVSNSEELFKDLLKKNEIDGAMFKIKDDPRITKVGKIIRKTSIDELPQLWNVLKNEMSLVGPRPSLPREVERYSSYDKQRMLVTPGCTGLWQVSGRNSLSFEQMVELDLHYIKHRSIWLDLKLIMKTVWVIILPNDAY